MCIIAMKSEKAMIPNNYMEMMWKNNPDGAGIMYAEFGKLRVIKGIMTLPELKATIQEIGPARKMVLHFRRRTHGANTPEMTHPFWVKDDRLALVHNGVITPLASKANAEKSDTALFAETLRKEMTPKNLKSRFYRDMLEAYIGYSKVVFMDERGETTILNEHIGEWHKNVWYSNKMYKEARISPIGSIGTPISSMPPSSMPPVLLSAPTSVKPAATPKSSPKPAPKEPKEDEKKSSRPKQKKLLGVKDWERLFGKEDSEVVERW